MLQEGEFERVGSNETIKVDVRVIAATNRDLAESVRDKSFRADLYYRLNIFPIHVPALRDRKEDIPLLANFFLTRFSRKLGKNLSGFTDSAMTSLMEYQWPGNIRELQNVIERAVVVSAHEDAVITGPITGEVTQSISTDGQHDKGLENVERSHIIKVLEETRWVINGKGGAAEILNINPNTLRSRMKKLHIKRPEERI
ncbi:MAG: sigma 54-interacting transcriptional regulator [Thermodesulfobacteriota bacterium]